MRGALALAALLASPAAWACVEAKAVLEALREVPISTDPDLEAPLRTWTAMVKEALAGGLEPDSDPRLLRQILQAHGRPERDVLGLWSLVGPGWSPLPLTRRLPGMASLNRLAISCQPAPPSTGATTLVTLLATAQLVRVNSVPTLGAPGGQVTVEGTLLSPAYTQVRLLVMRPGGDVFPLTDLIQRKTTFRATFATPDKGRHEVQVVATGPEGARPLAQWSLWVGLEPRTKWLKVLYPPDPPGLRERVAGQHALKLLNRHRQRAGCPLLAENSLLSDIAQAYSRNMRDHGFFGHRSNHFAGLKERITSSRLLFDLACENLAAAGSLAAAESDIMASPIHRLNALDRRLTHGGVGVAIGKDQAGRKVVFVTQLLARLYRLEDADALVQRLVDSLNHHRSLFGHPSLFLSPALSAEARSLARKMVTSPGDLDRQHEITRLRPTVGCRNLDVFLWETASLAPLVSSDEALDINYGLIGAAINPAMSAKGRLRLFVALLLCEDQ